MTRTFTCAGCGLRQSPRSFGGGLTNELMHDGEAAPLCERCIGGAKVSGKSRRRIERAVRRHCRQRVPGLPERVVIVDAAPMEYR